MFQNALPLLVSGTDKAALFSAAEQMLATLQNTPDDALQTLVIKSIKQQHQKHRGAVLAKDRQGFTRGLLALCKGRSPRNVLIGEDGVARKPVFVFPGLGLTWPGMTAGLLNTLPTFRAQLQHYSDHFRPFIGLDMVDELLTGRKFEDLQSVQPLLFSIPSALADVWRAFGVEESATVGHSVGEIAAAHASGALSIENAVKLIDLWMRKLGPIEGQGGMISVSASAQRVAPLLEPWKDRLFIGAFNSPESVTVCGEAKAIAEINKVLEEQGLWTWNIPGGVVAGHTPLVEFLREPIQAEAPPTPGGALKSSFYSAVSGQRMSEAQLTAQYWFSTLREPVYFEKAVRALVEDGHRLFIEVTANPVLAPVIQQVLQSMKVTGAAVATLDSRRDDRDSLLHAFTHAYVNGATIRWDDALALVLPAEQIAAIVPAASVASVDQVAVPASSVPLQLGDFIDIDVLRAYPAAQQKKLLLDLIARETEIILECGYTSSTDKFFDIGFTSMALVELAKALTAAIGQDVPATVVYSHPTPLALAEHLRVELGLADDMANTAGIHSEKAAHDDEQIAIVGMACRYPGGIDTPEALWELLEKGRDAIGDLPTDRDWDVSRLYDPIPGRLGKLYQQKGGFLINASSFDAGFFGILPREALSMEPQQRLMLEISWEALERAGIDPTSLHGSNTGVFVGIMPQEYGPPIEQATEDMSGYRYMGSAACVASGRMAYVLGLMGPTLTVDTACSSSLTAIHLACDALRNNDCDIALAGGATVMSTPGVLIDFSRLQALAPDGRCKAFSSTADGVGLAEGAGVLVLQRLSSAQRDGREILAVITSSAVNQDGASNGLSAPNGAAQQRLIRHALARAGWKPDDVDALDAHGTGTRLGDPIEADAILSTYGQGREGKAPLLLGSIKSNLGHTQAAAGVASVIKMALAMQHGLLPRSLHIEKPSDALDWTKGFVKLLEQPQSWERRNDHPRRAAISSFGVSGTNCHLLLQEAPAVAQARVQTKALRDIILPLSAKTETALQVQAERLRHHILTEEQLNLSDAGFTLGTARARFACRSAVWGRERGQIVEALQAIAEGRDHPAATQRSAASGKLVFVFPGQGAQWPRMGMELYETHEVFRTALDQADAALALHTGWSVLAVLRGDASAPSLLRVDVVQPSLFAVSISLARLWQSLGIVPDAIVGHSFGEIAAAYVAGVLTLEDAARLTAVRAKTLMEVTIPGIMANIGLSEQRTRALIETSGRNINLAVFNSPTSTVVSGSAAEMDALMQLCEAEGVYVKRIAVDVLAHSPELRVLCPTLKERVGNLTLRPANVSFYSTVDGYAGESPTSGHELGLDYWCDNLCNPVRFVDTISRLAAQGNVTFLECSPHPILLPAIEETADLAENDIAAIGTLKRTKPSEEALAEAVARLFTAGHAPDWRAFYPDASCVRLPTYPFERSRYWLSAHASHDVTTAGQRVASHALLSAIIDLPNNEGCVLTGRIGLKAQPWMADHGASGIVLVPGTAYLDMMLEAATIVGAGGIEELVLQAPMVLEGSGMLDIQLRVDPRTGDGFWPVSLHARKSVGDAHQPRADWELHATGLIAAQASRLYPDEELWPPRNATEQDLDTLRNRLAMAGYDYGRAFSGLTRLWRDGTELFVEAQLPDGLTPVGHSIHPALLDAILHPIALPEGTDSFDELRLPFTFNGVACSGESVTRLRARLSVLDKQTVRIRAFDDKGTPVVTVDKLTLRPTSRDSLRRRAQTRPDHDLLEISWNPLPVSDKPAVTAPALENAVLLDASDDLIRALAGNATCAEIAALEEATAAPAAIIWPLPQTDQADMPRATRELNERVVNLLQHFGQSKTLANTILVVLTRNAVTTGLHEVPDPVHSSAWAMIHSAQNEMPDRFVLIDIDQVSHIAEPLQAALASGRPQIAIRSDKLYVPSLTRIDAAPGLLDPADGKGWRLDLVNGEGIEALGFVADDRGAATLAPGQIRVEVRAAGLNFYDIACSIGLVAKRHDFGAEAAGVVLEVGPGVTHLAAGDRVVVMAEGCFGPQVVADARIASRFPAHWSFAQAASVPIAFVTTYYALVEMARIKPGEKVLVHAGAGGVGQSAIQLARHLGAEVFATASPRKWGVLRALGIPDDHIANSRSLDFAAQFKQVTGGAGVDVVINSLAGDFIDETMAIMAPGGRFVEIGKTDVREVSAVAAAHPQITYHYLDWGVTSGFDSTQRVFAALMEMFEAGALAPLPITAVGIQQAREAFQMMQGARHTGKIVLTMPRRLDPQGTVLITGGTGTLGALLAEHLVTVHGARRLLLVSRNGPASPDASAVREMLEAHGAEVVVRACDTSDPLALAQLLNGISTEHPLTGIFHTAGVLADATIANLTVEQIRKVFAPKVDAAWHLHELTKCMDLSVFALYSSINGVLGNAGQGNYAAANTFMDSLAIMRRRLGLPATALGWGWWQPVTNLSRNFNTADTARIARVGFAPITVDHGHALLDAAIDSPFPALAASPFNQQTLDENSDIGVLHPLLVRLAGGRAARRGRSAADKAADLLRELKGLGHSARVRKVEALIMQQTISTLGLGEGTKLKTEESFKDIGIDSLMALSLRNQINMAFGLRLPATLVYDFPTPRTVADHLIERLFPNAQMDEDVAQDEPSAPSEAQIRATIDSIPIARLRDLGLLDTLLRLGSGNDIGTDDAGPESIDKIQSASTDELLKLASLKQVEELQ